MKVVMPLGREKATLDANFDVMPYAGCACSNVNGEWLTVEARNNGGPGMSCQCDCSYGTANKVANDQMGRESSEW